MRLQAGGMLPYRWDSAERGAEDALREKGDPAANTARCKVQLLMGPQINTPGWEAPVCDLGVTLGRAEPSRERLLCLMPALPDTQRHSSAHTLPRPELGSARKMVQNAIWA